MLMQLRESPARAGFTLVELMVAMVVSAIVVLGARMLLEQLSDSASRTVAAATRADRQENGERLLRDLAGRLEVGAEQAARFSGEPSAANFVSWCDVASGWQERCAVTLVVGAQQGHSVLVATLASGDSVTLLVREQQIELRYLDDPRGGGRWFASWGAGITAPLALGVISGADTMIVRIGDRG
jgi:prepilin-type N-terminal cleavage/methylation domain-containing protein